MRVANRRETISIGCLIQESPMASLPYVTATGNVEKALLGIKIMLQRRKASHRTS